MNVRQPKIPARIAIGQPLVVKTHQLENRRVQIMDVNRIFGRPEAEFIGRAVRLAKLQGVSR